jgi:hypothetical protein
MEGNDPRVVSAGATHGSSRSTATVANGNYELTQDCSRDIRSAQAKMFRENFDPRIHMLSAETQLRPELWLSVNDPLQTRTSVERMTGIGT